MERFNGSLNHGNKHLQFFKLRMYPVFFLQIAHSFVGSRSCTLGQRRCFRDSCRRFGIEPWGRLAVKVGGGRGRGRPEVTGRKYCIGTGPLQVVSATAAASWSRPSYLTSGCVRCGRQQPLHLLRHHTLLVLEAKTVHSML